jgi:hypothetical protein
VKYFIVYTHIQNNVPIFGNVDITVDKIIENIADIREIELSLKCEYGFKQLVILNWRKFD